MMQTPEVAGTSVARFDNAVPDFAGQEMDRLYGNPYASLLQMQIYDSVDKEISTFVARNNGVITQVLLYRVCGHRVRVMNEGMKISSEDVSRFSDYIFANYPQAHTIVFHAVETDPHLGDHKLRFLCQKHNCLEDICMPLPDTEEAYRASLGKNTRRNLKRYMERLLKNFPSFRFEVYDHAEVREEHVRRVIECNRSRMAVKKKMSDIDEVEANRIYRMARTCGMVSIAFIDDLVCGGTVTYRTGDNYFLYVLSHDPSFDSYWIGMLTCYFTIVECIKRGGKEFHFLWGRYDYKFTLGAKMRNLDHLTVYRSPVQMLRHMKTAASSTWDGYKRRAQLWLRYDVMEKHKRFGNVLRQIHRTMKPS